MKSLIYFTHVLALSLVAAYAYAQTDELDKSKYPFVTKDVAGDYISGEGRIQPGIRIALPIPGAWGFSATGEFLQKNMVYGAAEIGYGWGLTTNKDYTKPSRLWFSADVGYPILYFKKPKKGKWVVHQESVYAGGRSATRSEYFNVSVPNHHFVIVQAGYTRTPYSHNSNSLDNGTAGVSMLVVAPAYRVGVKYKTYSSANIRVKERDSGTVYSGQTLRISEFYLGLVLPAKSMVAGGPANFNELHKSGPGFEMQFKIPMLMNGLATLDLGVRSIGYGDKGQLYIGNTFNIR